MKVELYQNYVIGRLDIDKAEIFLCSFTLCKI